MKQRFSFIVVAIVIGSALSFAQVASNAPPPQSSAEKPAERIEEISRALKGRADDAAAFESLRTLIGAAEALPTELYNRARELIKTHSADAKDALAATGEPGERLIVIGVVRDTEGKPVRNALLYVFHTNKDGVYSFEGGNVGSSGDSLEPRLFGYMRTGDDGRYEYRTVRPGGYPGNGPPQHVHYEVSADGYAETITELMFDDDPRMTAETRRWAKEAGFIVAKTTRETDGSQRCECDVVLKKA